MNNGHKIILRIMKFLCLMNIFNNYLFYVTVIYVVYHCSINNGYYSEGNFFVSSVKIRLIQKLFKTRVVFCDYRLSVE